MASLFQGAPQTATSYATSSSETPKWMQDAIYNQIQWATNTSNIPYQAYDKPLVAGLSPLQTKAYQNVEASQGAWQPTVQAAQAGTTALSAAPGGYQAAMPYLQNAAAPVTANIDTYMNPYTANVTDRLAQLGARNLSENLLPNVSDAFVRAGQFGSGRMGEFGSRALRDTQESVLGQQSQALQAGYGQALSAAGTDAARQLQTGQAAGSLTQADIARQQSTLAQMAQLAQQGQGMATADTAALEAAGAAQQTQQQKELESQYQQYQIGLQYPKSQLDWLNAQVRGMAPLAPTQQTQTGSTTGATYSASPLQQLATGYLGYKGLTSALGQ